MPAIPLPMLPSHVSQESDPSANPISAFMTMPIDNTATTLIPDMASPITEIYGISLYHAIEEGVSIGATFCPMNI